MSSFPVVGVYGPDPAATQYFWRAWLARDRRVDVRRLFRREPLPGWSAEGIPAFAGSDGAAPYIELNVCVESAADRRHVARTAIDYATAPRIDESHAIVVFDIPCLLPRAVVTTLKGVMEEARGAAVTFVLVASARAHIQDFPGVGVFFVRAPSAADDVLDNMDRDIDVALDRLIRAKSPADRERSARYIAMRWTTLGLPVSRLCMGILRVVGALRGCDDDAHAAIVQVCATHELASQNASKVLFVIDALLAEFLGIADGVLERGVDER